ncbi:MAG: acyl-CoA dehydrogenase family protein, partial [Planctomycetaceae bacterium]|nr:acyl-CoA dehydrogenase family protein [Planctomycetaceae bacterium]
MSLETSNSTPDNTTNSPKRHDNVSFAETALRLGGKSADEARRTGALDTADDQVEPLFAERHRTTASPVHRAVWEQRVPAELFRMETSPVADDVRRVTDQSLAVVRRHRREGTLYDADGKLTPEILGELAEAGYWGALVDKRYGGCGLPFQHFAAFLTRVATIEPTVAGLASVHGCIGAVDPIRTFGSPVQKERYLPLL